MIRIFINELKEKKAHGTPAFPITAYEPWLGRINKHYAKVRCHWHDEWEICFIEEGNVLCGLNEETHIVSEGAIIFIPGGHLHFFEPIENNHWLFKSVVFSPNLLHLSSDELSESKYIRPFLKSQHRLPIILHSKAVFEIFDKAYKLLTEKPPFHELYIKACLFEILALWMEQSSIDGILEETKIQEENKTAVKYVLEHIHTNYDKLLSLSQLSVMVNMSKGHFIKVFRCFTGKTPIDYILKFRLSKAALLLRETDEKLIRIALDTGFNNISYFVRMFQKHFKCSPTDYRKKFK